MKKLIASIWLLASVAGPSSDRFRRYEVIQAYEVRPGIVITPLSTGSGDLCRIDIEKRHYLDNRVDMDADMSKELILSLFDELVPKPERGGPGWKLPADTEISESDLGMLVTRIPYQNVTLAMYGKKTSPDKQKFIWQSFPGISGHAIQSDSTTGGGWPSFARHESPLKWLAQPSRFPKAGHHSLSHQEISPKRRRAVGHASGCPPFENRERWGIFEDAGIQLVKNPTVAPSWSSSVTGRQEYQ